MYNNIKILLQQSLKQPDTVFNMLPWHPALHDYRGNPSDLLDRSCLKYLDLQGRPDDQTHVMMTKIKVQRQKIKDRADRRKCYH